MSLGNTLRRMSTSPKTLQITAGSAVLPPLPYGPEELEPYISQSIMTTHHDFHHAAYVKALNVAEVDFNRAQERGDLSTMLRLVPVIKFNGGGHYNHSIFWTNLAPHNKGGGGEPKGPLMDAINRNFTSFAVFKTMLSKAATSVQGSGWGWLVCKPDTKALDVTVSHNQDPVTDSIPLLGIDVWEHAYYLQYKNKRADYVDNIWNVINWANISERYEKALQAK